MGAKTNLLSAIARFATLLACLLPVLLPFQANAQENCSAYAGTMDVEFGPHCLVQGNAPLSGNPSADAVVPDGYASVYVLSRTNGLIIEQISPAPSFIVNSVDVWRIHRLVYDPAALDLAWLELGSSSAYDLQALITQGGGAACGSLSLTGAAAKTMECTEPCTAFASGMEAAPDTVCLVDGQATLAALPVGSSMVPAGFEQRYLLTRTSGLIIEQIAAAPAFTVTEADEWHIVHLIYDPTTLDLGEIIPGTTTAADLESLLLQGGGGICASMNITGAAFIRSMACSTACEADAGTASPDQPDECLVEGVAELQALPDGNAVVPEGYLMTYVLVSGSDQVVIDQNTLGQAAVTASGHYGIHPLVYEPATFDPAAISFGVTTLGELNAQFLQGGGDICASLDLAGASFQVVDCSPSCEADAGTMLSSGQSFCLEQGMAVLTANSYGDTVVPPGYAMGYLLSQGPGLLLLELGPEPLFEVTAPGTYRIHAFVYDPAAWNDLQVQWGTTTAYDLNELLVQGGGTICAGLDLLGTTLAVENCPPPCNAGTDSTITVCMADPPFEMFDLLGGDPCPGGIWSNAANPQVSGIFNPASDAAGAYMYTVADAFGNSFSAVLIINVFECPGIGNHPLASRLPVVEPAEELATGMDRGPVRHGFHRLYLWPNPAIGTVHLLLPFKPAASTMVQLTDATGRAVSASAKPVGNELLLDAAALAPGIWTVRLVHGNDLFIGRFVRQ